MRESGARTAGFTLIEILAAVFLTSLVVGLATAVYLNLSNAADTARERLQTTRHALAILDRVARDLEAAYLLEKPPELDPLFHPWLFLAESQTESEGSDRVKFITRNHRPRNPVGHGSDLAVVSYVLEPGEEGGYTLMRSVSPGLPEGLDREFPDPDNERSMLVAGGVASFGMRFLNEEGEWLDEWDSSLIEESSSLPLAAEIDLALAPPDREEEDPRSLGGLDADEPEHFKRRVPLPMRPVDLEMQSIAAAAIATGSTTTLGNKKKTGDKTGDTTAGEAGLGEMTVEQCLATNPGLRDKILEEIGSLGVTLPLNDLASQHQATLVALGFDCQ